MKYDREFVTQIAQLANLDLTPAQATKLASDFDDSMIIVDELAQIETKNVTPTYQVNNLTNVMRADQVNADNELSQQEALANASHTHNGYFLVKRVIHDDS